MDIEVTLYSPLQHKGLSKTTVAMAAGSTIDTLLQHLAIKQHEVGSVYINGKSGTFTQILDFGDKVTLLPLIGGG